MTKMNIIWKHSDLDGQLVSAQNPKDAFFLIKAITGKELSIQGFVSTEVFTSKMRVISTVSEFERVCWKPEVSKYEKQQIDLYNKKIVAAISILSENY